jgi:hypothetical protein
MSNDELQAQFPIGAKVYTKSAPHGQPGRVTTYKYGRVFVHFPSINFTARLNPESLILENEVSR